VQPLKDDPRNIFGWCMYDWANSAYTTTVSVALLPAYFAAVVVGPDGTRIGEGTYSATTLWGFVIGLSSLVAFAFAPVLGAVSDFSSTKKRFLLAFAYSGALFTALMYFSESGDVYPTLALILLAQVSFVGANVFYDAFLPEIASREKMDWVSGKGYSFGYVGGGLHFAFSLLLVAAHDTFGLTQITAVRIAIMTAALWWAGFAIFTVKYLRETARPVVLPEAYKTWPRIAAYVVIGATRTVGTTRRVARFKHLVMFLIAFMLYDDGVQTVILMASIYGIEELRLTNTNIMVTLLVIQIIATFGALVFSRIASKIGTKHAIMLSLSLWSGIVTYAYFITSATEFFMLGVVVGLVLGGTQALSRSFYGSMVPEEASAEFFGFYTVFSKFSAIWGPLIFGVIRQWAGSARLAIVTLIVFFVAGFVLLAFVDESKARLAKESGAF
jgi:UMF1 family MFS transporter